MALPSIVCDLVTEYDVFAGDTIPAAVPLNQVRVVSGSGSFTFAVWECNPSTSFTTPQQDTGITIDEDDFLSLWPPILLLLVTGFCIRYIIKAFE